MMNHSITFRPSGKTLLVPDQFTIWQAILAAGFTLDTPCGGAGTCAKCRVRICSGKTDPAPSAHRLTIDELTRGFRLACTTKITEPLEVEIPDVTLSAGHAGSILVTGESFTIDGDDFSEGVAGVAFDLGTTTVAGTLFDLHTGHARATHASMNLQIPMGDDVISRIAATRASAESLRQLQSLAVKTLNEIIRHLCTTSGIPHERIHRITVAGNTTMQQILLGLDPSPLGEKPFTPAFLEAQTVPAQSIGLFAHADAHLIVFPQIGGFVGGDTIAGLLAIHADELKKPTLLIDIGTNGEIALIHEGGIFAASTAAGPAFEGARIRQGMRAIPGAIDQIWIQNGMLAYHVMGGLTPKGLCGLALIDSIAVLLQLGLIEASGSFAIPEHRTALLSDQLVNRLIETTEGPCYVLAQDSQGHPHVSLTQQDVRELQLASGALRSGIDTLLKKAGLETSDLDAVLIAGGFGNYIRKENAIAIGLLPKISDKNARFIGNASLTGAKRALLSRKELARAETIRRKTLHVELAAEPGFTDFFMDAMFLGAR